MYHLTKDFLSESNDREEIFNIMLTNHYSNESLFKYKELYESKFLEKSITRYTYTDVGYNIRHMLVAIALKGNMLHLKIISNVSGKGKFYFCSDWFEYVYSNILAECAHIAEQNTVYNFVKINDNKLSIDIKYSGNVLPKLFNGFCGALNNKNVKIHYSADLVPAKFGVRKSANNYLFDRLSSVTLAFLQKTGRV